MTLLEPIILFRLIAGAVAAILFAHSAFVGGRVVRYFRLSAATEGQLALERQSELSATSARVGAVVQVLALLLSVVGADRLTGMLRGAMCGYGVVHATSAGPRSLIVSVAAAVLAGVQLQLLALDRGTRGLGLVRPLAYLSLVVAFVSFADLSLAFTWLSGLDMTVVSSCCSTTVDTAAVALEHGHGAGPRVLVTAASLVALPLTILVAALVSRRPTRGGAVLGGILSVVSLPLALATIVLEIAPYVYEVPHHRCPYCLFRADAYGIGYPLFGAVLAGVVYGVGALAAALLAGVPSVADSFTPFARKRLRRQAFAFGVALLVGVAPVLRYAILAPGASLFP